MYVLGIWDCMTNQEVVDFVHAGVAQDKTLETICENIMDNCLANDQTASGLGYDNMSVMIIAILNGKTKKEWYEAIKAKNKSSSSSNKTTSDTPPAAAATPAATTTDTTTTAATTTLTTTSETNSTK